MNENNKRVVQISLDILAGENVDGFSIGDEVADELERHGFIVLGASFVDDMTDFYKRNCPKVFEV